MPFCPECQSLLSLPDFDPIQCGICNFTTSFAGKATQVNLMIDPAVFCDLGRLCLNWVIESVMQPSAKPRL